MAGIMTSLRRRLHGGRLAGMTRRLLYLLDLGSLAIASGRTRLSRRRWGLPRATASRAVRSQPPEIDGLSNYQTPVTFTYESKPRASIIVPVFNHLEQTQRCLHSVAAVGAACTFELVVVDDGCTDGTAAWLAACPQVRVHRMDCNSGFVAACNAGAAVARGEYLVFLNNDTEVTAGWLDELVATFSQVPRCGLAGAKLVYPDGRLQEAGGIVFADGNACNYGRGEDPDEPRFNFTREVDYCSGACIAIPANLFNSLAGFDTRYAPAYYEDTDLAFAVRASGYQVIYQPRARVVHFEGVTAGTEASAGGAKRFQEINRQKFALKWQLTLIEQPSTDDFSKSPLRCAVYGRSNRVLVVDMTYPRPDRDSGSLRMFNILILLRELGCHVLFLALDVAEDDGEYASALEQNGVELVPAASRGKALRWWYAQGSSLDLVLLSRLPVALVHMGLARRYACGARIVFDTVDLHFLRLGREAALQSDKATATAADRFRHQELNLVKRADTTLVVSEYEKDLLRRLVPANDVRILSNVHPVHGRGALFLERTGLLFLGNFEHAPNVDAASWLIKDIMPRVRARLPGVVLHVIGHAADMVLAGQGTDDVWVHGYVADLEPVLRSVRLALAPLRYGAGVKGKINMAMSYGLPVVTTSVGAEGMGLVHERDVMVADEADAFAAAVAVAYQDEQLWDRLSCEGLENVRRHFSPDAAKRALAGLLAGCRQFG